MVAMGLNCVTLLRPRRIGHESPAATDHLYDACPHVFSDSATDFAHIYAGGHLHEPTGQDATQTLRAGGEDDDDHQSTPYDVPPATTRSAPSHR